MKYFLIGTTLLVSILLIVVVVAQESKQPGMGSAIGGGAEATFGDNDSAGSFGKRISPEAVAGGKTRGKDAVLSKFTVVFGIIFAVLCLVLGRYMNTF